MSLVKNPSTGKVLELFGPTVEFLTSSHDSETMVTRYWHVKPILYKSLTQSNLRESFYCRHQFIDGIQYNANIRDPINDTTFLTPYFILAEILLDRNMSGVTIWNSLIT